MKTKPSVASLIELISTYGQACWTEGVYTGLPGTKEAQQAQSKETNRLFLEVCKVVELLRKENND